MNSGNHERPYKKLFKQADNSPLILFRIVFGCLLFYHTISFILNGSVYENFIQPPFTFNFIGFDFLQPLPGNGMYFYFGLMALFALMIMVGGWYRLGIISFTIMWAGIYLMQKSNYNNHYYLVLLLCFLMIFMPANNYYSIDVKRKAVVQENFCPRWVNLVFIAQVAIVYFFAATSKLNAPDWFSGKFMAIQFSRWSTHHIVGVLYSQKWFQLLICYSGFFFDLLIVPLLLWKKSRPYAFIASCLFHLFNSFTFSIGIFPYLSIALTLFFFEPEKIRHIFFRSKPTFVPRSDNFMHAPAKKKWIMYGLGIYFLIQLILPVRYLFFPGNVFWTDEGYRMSWKMMLRTKSGKIYFKVVDPPSGKIWKIEPAKIFSPSHMMWLSTSPDIIWQYAQRIKNDFVKKGFPDVEVYAIDSVSLNRSPYKPLVNSTVNLATVKWEPFRHSRWIEPFK